MRKAASRVRPFQLHLFPEGHRATHVARWFKGGKSSNGVYEVAYRIGYEPYMVGVHGGNSSNGVYEVAYRIGYEPYMVVQEPFPLYDETFVRYGQNKARVPALCGTHTWQVSYTYELAAARFQFWVAPNAWLVHVHIDHRQGKHKDADGQPLSFQAPSRPHAKDWTVGWSCWPKFMERIAKTYSWRPAHACWSAGFLLPKTIEKWGGGCVGNGEKRERHREAL
ncbi:hypothetical protein T484DRAFT_1770947 [Baffinella frigidus]|nr:hypothetical protein T484DRAFT_1770947 [Cryptophyta sp. CCMP2293]